MPIRWMAVITGFVVDYVVTALLMIVVAPEPAFFDAPDLRLPAHLVFLILALLSTGVGGFVAARMASGRYELHGLLVGVVGILFAQFQILAGAPNPPKLFVIASAVGCAVGALGGLVARAVGRTAPSLDR